MHIPQKVVKRQYFHIMQERSLSENIAKGTTDPGVDYFDQLLWFGLAGLV